MNEYIEALVKIGNLRDVIEECEPSVCYHFQVEDWMVKRILKAQELFEDEWLRQNPRRAIQEAPVSDERTIQGDS